MNTTAKRWRTRLVIRRCLVLRLGAGCRDRVLWSSSDSPGTFMDSTTMCPRPLRSRYFCFHWLYTPLRPWPLLFSFMTILQTVGLLGRVISLSQGLYLNTGQHKHRINTYTHQTSMPYVGFDPTIPASERAKAVHAFDRSTTVTGPDTL
jgi:hypothetical protein